MNIVESQIHTIPKGTKVLITGGTGFAGSVLIRKLAHAQLKVNAIARMSSRIEHLADLDITWFSGEVYDPEVVKQACDGVEYIFHLAGAYREAKISDDEYHLVHVESTRLLAHAAMQQKNFKRFLHTSTVGVHGHVQNPPADEDAPFNPGDIYQKTKAEGESWVRGFAQQTELPLTVIRPAAVYGPSDRRLFKVFVMVSRGLVPIVNGHNILYHLIHVEDLTNFYLHCAAHPQAQGEVFICGNPEHTTFKDIVSIIAKTYHKKIRYIDIPAGPLLFITDICEFICKKVDIEPPLYRRRVAFFIKDRSFITSKMRNMLNFQIKYSIDEGISQTAIWYLKYNWIKV